MARTILVLDDDPGMREALADILEVAGYGVLQASDSVQALSLARRVSLDVVVTDVRMAGVDGIDTVEVLLCMQPTLKAIVITGYASDSAPARAVRVGAIDYLYKPFGSDVLVQAVKRALGVEEESRGYQSLLARVVAGYRSLLDLAGMVAAKARFGRLEAERDRAFQALYVSIRSQRLSQAEALELWERLLPIEEQREQLKSSKPNQEVQRKLGEAYQSISVLLGAIERAQQAGVELGRVLVPDEHRRFPHLYQRVLDGSVSLEQLKLAPTLQALAPEELAGSVELKQLYRHVWGSGV